MRGNPPPDGFRLFVYPKYILTFGDTVRIKLPRNMGEILSILMGSRGTLLSVPEIASTMFRHRYDETPECQWYLVKTVIFRLRDRLKEHGVVIDLDSRQGKRGYRFMGFGECEPLPECVRTGHKWLAKRVEPKPRKTREPKKPKKQFVPNPNAMTTNELKRRRGKPPMTKFGRISKPNNGPKLAPPKVLPPQYVAAQQAPWHFPERHPNHQTGKWGLRDEGD